MFVGHIALGLAAKRVVPSVSLAVLLSAAQLADVLWPVFVAAGIEQVRIDPGNTAFTALDFVSYPYSHSLVALIVWGVLFGFIYRRFAPFDRVVTVIAALVVSHWVLDVVTHRPDMPIYPGSRKFGLGLWNSIPATLAIELVLYGIGLWVYLRATEAGDRIGHWAFMTLAIFLGVGYVAAIGNVPPSIPSLYTTALVGAAVLIAWSWWADTHRTPRLRRTE